MNYSNKTSVSYRIATAIFENGPLRIEDAAELIKEHSIEVLRSTFGRMCFGGDLQKKGDAFDLKPGVRNHFVIERAHTEAPQVAEARTAPGFKPLSDKHKFWLAPRREPLREVSFINGGCEYRQLGEPA